MPIPLELKPKEHHRVMDLVASAGVNVSDWANYTNGADNPAANPRYCYEWCFIEPNKVVVLNLWFEEIQEHDGSIFQDLNYRTLARTFVRTPSTATWERRAHAMDAALQLAWREKLKVRVIICDGERRDITIPGTEASRVKCRLLDPESWAVTNYDWNTGRTILARGVPPEPFVDQFTTQTQDETVIPRRTRLIVVAGRSTEVRRAVLYHANGKCQWCGEQGFKMTDGRIFLETHHVIPLSEGGPDQESNVVALCPNHHREVHYGERAQQMRKELLDVLNVI